MKIIDRWLPDGGPKSVLSREVDKSCRTGCGILKRCNDGGLHGEATVKVDLVRLSIHVWAGLHRQMTSSLPITPAAMRQVPTVHEKGADVIRPSWS